MLQGLADRLGIGLKHPVIQRNIQCPQELQGALWSSYVLHRQEGLAPLYVRKAKNYAVKVYKYHCYVVKEYTGDTSMLAAEVAVLQQLQHESLVSYLFIVDEGARFSIVMDWAGQGLRDLVQQQHQQQHQLGEDIARHITYQLTSSLVYLHQKGIIHRDIKPDNIGVQPDFTVKLFDWGEALLLEQLSSMTDKQLAKAAGVAGTPTYMPPEMLLYLTRRSKSGGSRAHADPDAATLQRHDASPVRGCSCWGKPSRSLAELQQQGPGSAASLRDLTTPKLDIWGLGTVVYFLLAGKDILKQDSSYELEDMAEVVNARGGIKLPSKVRVSPDARDFLRLCLERDPAKRAAAEDLLQHPWLSGPKAAAAATQRASTQLNDVAGKPLLPGSPALSLSRTSEAAYVISAHRELMSRTSSSAPDTPLSGATDLEASDYE